MAIPPTTKVVGFLAKKIMKRVKHSLKKDAIDNKTVCEFCKRRTATWQGKHERAQDYKVFVHLMCDSCRLAYQSGFSMGEMVEHDRYKVEVNYGTEK